MENLISSKLAMYREVQAVCDAQPAVWRRSEKFAEAYAEFCGSVKNLVQLQPAVGVFKSVTRGIAVELAVADTILTTEMDELIEQFEPVDVAFVDAYTEARSRETCAGPPSPAMLPAAQAPSCR